MIGEPHHVSAIESHVLVVGQANSTDLHPEKEVTTVSN